MTDVQLREPLWLLLVFTPGIVWLLAHFLKRWQQTAYADTHLRAWVEARQPGQRHTRLWQAIFLQLAWMSFAIAMAGPRYPMNLQNTGTSFDNELMVVVDLSFSMSAHDSRPSRIERVKLELLDLIERAQHTRIGLVVFAAQPHVLCPATTDKSVLRHYVQALRSQLLPTAGSRIPNALAFAAQQFHDDTQTSKSILLISDGENNNPLKNNIPSLMQTLKQHNIHLYVLGVGTESGAALMTRQHGWLQYDQQAVVSRLHSDFLQQLSEKGNGAYRHVSDDDSDWQALYDSGIARLPLQHKDDKQTTQIQWREMFSGFLLFGLACLLIAGWQRRFRPHSSVLIAPIICMILLHISPETRAADSFDQAMQLYQQGDYQHAREMLASIPGYEARFAEGSANYQQGHFQQAIPVFVQAILDATTEQQRSNAIFNLANCYFKLENYAMAKSLYEDVLRYQGDHRGAQINLKYATALSEQQKANPLVKAQRAGSGPRSADTPPGLDVGLGKLSLGETTSSSQDDRANHLDSSSKRPAQQVLQQSRPASGQVEYDKDLSWTYDVTRLSTLQQSPPRIETDESVLWQRLFEVEENFEAAQEEPNSVPGVKPW